MVARSAAPEEKADIIGPHKWPGFLGEGKETLAYGRAATAFLPEGTQGSHCTQPSGLCRSCRPGAPLACVEARRALAIGPALAIRDPASRPTFRLRPAGSAV